MLGLSFKYFRFKICKSFQEFSKASESILHYHTAFNSTIFDYLTIRFVLKTILGVLVNKSLTGQRPQNYFYSYPLLFELICTELKWRGDWECELWLCCCCMTLAVELSAMLANGAWLFRLFIELGLFGLVWLKADTCCCCCCCCCWCCWDANGLPGLLFISCYLRGDIQML